MKKEDLIKKLERASLPEIEITSHRERLKKDLLENYFPTKNKWETFLMFRKAAFASLAVIILLLASFYFIYPQYTLAKMEKIVLADPQIKEFLEKGSILKEMKVIGNKGYALISPAQEGELLEIKQEKLAGVLVEVNLKEKRVSRIERITPQIFLDEKEEEKAKEIAKENPEVKKSIPKEAEISEVRSIPSELELIQKGEEIEVSPKEKKATVIYKLNEKKWEGRINLKEEKVEEIEILDEDEKENIKLPTTTDQEELKPSTPEMKTATPTIPSKGEPMMQPSENSDVLLKKVEMELK